MPGEPDSVTTRLSLPATVLLERRMVTGQRWQVPSWYLTGVVVGDQLRHIGADGEKVRDTETGEEFSWSGFRITFYRDACERYWHALIGDKPLVYVVCREGIDDSDVPLEPLVVTCDYDEATAFAETDDTVLSAPIPGDLYRHMEAFVLEHYKPKPFKKRRRKRWSEGDAGGPQSS